MRKQEGRDKCRVRSIASSRETTKGRKTETAAHLETAIKREDYSIALTKCFQNTVKL